MNDNLKLWIISGAFGGLLFAINLALGASLTYSTGNPGFSGLITGLTTSFVFYILHRVTKTFGAITIAFTVYAILAIPTVLLGPPGVYKIVVGFLSGIAFDSVLFLGKNFKHKLVVFCLGFMACVLIMIPSVYFSYIFLALPELERFKSLMFILAAIFTFQGWIAAFLARKFFNNRLKKLSSVENISLSGLDE